MTRPFFLLAIAATTLAHVLLVVARHTIDIVYARRLLPRWDLATHLGHGWMDYHLLVTGQIHRLVADLWLQGYWPPLLSIYQVPFYLVLGGGITAGLWSSLVAFGLTGLAGAALLWRQSKDAGPLSAAVFLALLMSSPFLLAYASVTMTETFGALMQLVVLLAYGRYREDANPRTATWFAVSLTLLFFTKYNYFVLLAAPLVIHEWLERTSGWSAGHRATTLWRWTRRALSSPTAVLSAVYLAGVLIIVRTGGFDFRLFGQRVSVHTVGNSGHILLYALLARLWYLHRRGRIDWARLTSLDLRIRPLLIWFVVPVTIWMASPYPNHIRDFVNLVINLPVGEPTVSAGLASYVDALRTSYFYDQWLLVLVGAALGVAAVRYGQQPPVMRWLLLAIPLQLAVIALHRTRWPRYLLLTVVLLCLAASSEIGRWFAASRRGRIAATMLAPVVLACGVMAARQAVTESRFRVVAFENYTEDQSVRAALDLIRGDLTGRERLAIVGLSNELSPALVRWELGPPSGIACVPFEVGGAQGKPLARATRVLLIEPSGAAAADQPAYALAQRAAVLEQAERGELVLRRDIPLPTLKVALRFYDRRSPARHDTLCE